MSLKKGKLNKAKAGRGDFISRKALERRALPSQRSRDVYFSQKENKKVEGIVGIWMDPMKEELMKK